MPVHMIPQPPQLVGSTLVGMHAPLQKDWYVGHSHVPLTQNCPPGHVVVHAAPGMPLLLPVDAPLEPPEPLLTEPLLPPEPEAPLLPLPLLPLDEPLLFDDDELPHAAATSVAAQSATPRMRECCIAHLPDRASA
jgi:hypothetical protein